MLFVRLLPLKKCAKSRFFLTSFYFVSVVNVEV